MIGEHLVDQKASMNGEHLAGRTVSIGLVNIWLTRRSQLSEHLATMIGKHLVDCWRRFASTCNACAKLTFFNCSILHIMKDIVNKY